MQKILILIGLFVLLTGVFWPLLVKIPLGRLPVNIYINRPGLKVFMPIASMRVASIIVSIILGVFRK